ncbi:MAG: hypothetical protein IK954_01310 [Clostridia bacterium]|nr:hypothetical protein [Clostridia bacterium]
MKIEIKRFGLTHNPKKEKQQSKKIITQTISFLCVFIVLAIAITAIIAYLIQRYIACISVGNDLDSLWIGSFASYLGGTIGGIFSGAFAFLGVFYTIKYYKSSDDIKEKSAAQPFLLVTTGSDKTPNKGYTLGVNNNTDSSIKDINVTVRNIGNGFASILTIHTGSNFSGLEYNKTLCVDEKDFIFLKVDPTALKEGIAFRIQYIDSMRNEYVQEYTITEKNKHIDIESGYPQFLNQV